MEKLLKIIDRYREYYNISIQMYQGEVNVYVTNRNLYETEIFSICGYSFIDSALNEAIERLQRIKPL